MKIEFDQIQGNSFGGFSKDHTAYILLEITDAKKARATFLKASSAKAGDSIYDETSASSSSEVLKFNNQFKALRAQAMPEGTITATWTNFVLTASGLKKLDAPGLAQFPKAFRQGMLARAVMIGDTDGSKPGNWNNGMGQVKPDWAKLDAMILIASDAPDDVKPGLGALGYVGRTMRYLQRLSAANSGVKVLGVIQGETRQDQVGHEHFGFKDGVSQPGIRGVTPCDDPAANPNQGNPGQDLLHPGEFVLGYARQIPMGLGEDQGVNPNPGAIAGHEFYPSDPPDSQVVLPKWAENGSFLVFRRLAQDVAGFRSFVSQTAGDLGISPDLLGAKLVGRYASGAPLEKIKFLPPQTPWPPLNDPGMTNPSLANSDTLNNTFEYGDDEDGSTIPRAAHIRKAYPRDQVPKLEAKTAGSPPVPVGKITNSDAESRTQTHRLLRRGIPFGKSLWAPEDGGLNDPRGLLFFAYQSDIERQFEFVQTAWVNEADFPRKGDGQDPIIAQSKPSSAISGCPFHAMGNAAKCPALRIQPFVKTRGGGYFFSPSVAALGALLDAKLVQTLAVTHPVPALGTADSLAATQTPGLVTIRASGTVPTPMHRVALVPGFLTIFPPEFRLEVTPPDSPTTQVLTPFAVEASFIAVNAISTVQVIDANGPHIVKVDQAQD